MAELRGDPVGSGAELVPVVEGWRLPAYFEDSVTSETPPYSCTIAVLVQAGQPRTTHVRIDAAPGSTLSEGQLRVAGSRLHEHLREVVERRMVPPPLVFGPDTQMWDSGATWDKDAVWATPPPAAVVRQAMAKGRRRRIDQAFLEGVVEQYDKGGVPAVVGHYGGDERSVRRWLARAREVGLR